MCAVCHALSLNMTNVYKSVRENRVADFALQVMVTTVLFRDNARVVLGRIKV